MMIMAIANLNQILTVPKTTRPRHNNFAVDFGFFEPWSFCSYFPTKLSQSKQCSWSTVLELGRVGMCWPNIRTSRVRTTDSTPLFLRWLCCCWFYAAAFPTGLFLHFERSDQQTKDIIKIMKSLPQRRSNSLKPNMASSTTISSRSSGGRFR